MRAVIYARYSTDMQSETSVEDQVRLCRERGERDGHNVPQVFSDYAISGSSLVNRPGMLSLMAAAKDGMFDLVYAEALDRISRAQEDIAGIHKRLTHADVGITTLSEGAINELHVGLKGTMNALLSLRLTSLSLSPNAPSKHHRSGAEEFHRSGVVARV